MAEFVDYIKMPGLNDPNVPAWDGTSRRVDPGTYDFEIVKVGSEQSRKGNNTLVVHAAVRTDGTMKDRQMRNSYVISTEDYAVRRMKALLQATGAIVDEQEGFAPESLIGCRFTADVVEDTFNDLDPKTGQQVSRTGTKWIGERAVEGSARVTQPARPAAQPAAQPATRRPAPPANNGGARR
jgi:hypothetical protein